MLYQISDGNLLVIVAGIIALAWDLYRQDDVSLNATRWRHTCRPPENRDHRPEGKEVV